MPGILAIDVGGTGLKAAVIDDKGDMLTDRARVPTPHPCPPKVFLEAITELVKPFPAFDRISVGFPGVVRNGCILTAPNLGTEDWSGFELAEALSKALDGIKSRDRGSADQIKADLAFHMIVLEASHNPLLRSAGGMIESGLVISFSLGWRTVMGDDAVLQHRDVYEAIRERNADGAYLAMRRLLRNAKGNVFDSIWVGRRGEAETEIG